MNVRATTSVASAMSLALICGCTQSGYKAAEKTNLSLSDTKTELITDKNNLNTAVDALNDLVYKPGTDLRPQYEKYANAVDALEKSAASSRKTAKGMVDNREAYLSKWRSDTAAINDMDLRSRALDRIAETEKEFSKLGTTLIDADNTLGPLVGKLKSLQVYLSGDLTANGIKGVTDLATAAKNDSITVNGKLDTAIAAIDKVSDQIAPMPAATSPAM